MPCSPARPRGGIARGATAPRPASASAAVQCSGGSRGSGGRCGSPGEVRAVQGLTLDASYSLPGSGSPRAHSRPRKWLKFKGAQGAAEGSPGGGGGEACAPQHSSADLDGCGGGRGWGGIFAFRRSVDGGK